VQRTRAFPVLCLPSGGNRPSTQPGSLEKIARRATSQGPALLGRCRVSVSAHPRARCPGKPCRHRRCLGSAGLHRDRALESKTDFVGVTGEGCETVALVTQPRMVL
jgi:hypothetical protein